MEKLKQENIDKAMEEIIERAVKRRSQNVTAKTLKAWIEQSKRITNEKLTTPEETIKLASIMESVKKKFIEQTF